MPKAAEDALMKVGKSKGYSGDRLNAFVFGILRHKFGWKPKRELKAGEVQTWHTSGSTV